MDKRVIHKKEYYVTGRNQGFTLVEMIVVMVILTVLAAILVPGLMGWIDEAKGKQIALD